jgi:hypothetical protein
MEISPMPPISEDCSSQGESEIGDENDSNFEQLMVSMLEERDKVIGFGNGVFVGICVLYKGITKRFNRKRID